AYAKANPLDVTSEELEFLQESQRRETEREQKARETARRRRIYAGIAVLAILTIWAWQQRATAIEAAAAAEAARTEADHQKATAQAAATQVAQQNLKAQAELDFYQATDPPERFAELSKLLNRSDLESHALARRLFF